MKKIDSYLKTKIKLLMKTDLDVYEKMILAFVLSYEKCFITNAQFMIYLSAKESTITRKIKSLVDKELIEIGKDKNGKRYLKSVGEISYELCPFRVEENNEAVVFKTGEVVFETTPSNIITIQNVSDGAASNSETRNEVEEELDHILENTGGLLSERYSTPFRGIVPWVIEEQPQIAEYPNPYEIELKTLEEMLNVMFKSLPTWKKILNSLGYRKFFEKYAIEYKLDEWMLDLIVAYVKKSTRKFGDE